MRLGYAPTFLMRFRHPTIHETSRMHNHRPALDAAMTLSLHFEVSWRRASEAKR
jgi:hypothetical protein